MVYLFPGNEEPAVQLLISTCFCWYFEKVLLMTFELITITANKGTNQVKKFIVIYFLFMFCFKLTFTHKTKQNCIDSV